MKKELVGEVLRLFISQSGKKERVGKDVITLGNDGVHDDKFYGKDIQRSILLASTKSYEKANQNSIDISYGELGENILIDYYPYDLEIGTKIQIGDAIIEISQEGTLCPGLSKVDSRLPKLLQKERGIFAKTLQGGTIKISDKVYLL